MTDVVQNLVTKLDSCNSCLRVFLCFMKLSVQPGKKCSASLKPDLAPWKLPCFADIEVELQALTRY